MTADLAALRRAAAEKPQDAERWHELGVACFEQGELEEAERCWRRVLEHERDHAKAHYNLGAVLHRRGVLAESARHYRDAIRLAPALAPARFGLGMLLHAAGERREALEQLRAAARLEPERADWHALLGSACNEADLLTEARASLERAVELDPRSGFAHEQLAGCILNMGDAAAAAKMFGRAWELDPSLESAGSNMIFAMDLVEEVTIEEQQAARRRWCERHARVAARAGRHRNDPAPDRRLRVGYVSADFRRHSASYVIAPILARHDRAQFDVFCYSGVQQEDEVTARLRRLPVTWRPAADLPDQALAEQIEADGIDILVDLSGHSAGNRLLVFARKPAPVQVTGWGHATGTGLDAIDYFVADPTLIPREKRDLFAEEIVDLGCYMCYEPPAYMPQVSPLPVRVHGQVTFGCINRTEKISNRSIALWARILAGAAGATLFLKHRGLGDAATRGPLVERMARGGIDPARLRFADYSTHAEHLRVFHQIDLGLDPYPQCGGVSTLEALWMGVPVVALKGATLPSRLSASLLGALGLPEWVAADDNTYVQIALDAARDLPRLENLRRCLRARCTQSPLGDTQRYLREVEAVYRSLWQRWCAGEARA